MRRLLILAVVVLVVAVVAAGCVPQPPGVSFHRKALREKHNNKRARYALGPLMRHAGANTNAQIVANRISGESGYGGCTLVHTSGQQLLAWYNAPAAESIACQPGCIDSGAAFKQFWGSTTHRGFILDGRYRWIGIGIQCNGPMSYFAIHYVA